MMQIKIKAILIFLMIVVLAGCGGKKTDPNELTMWLVGSEGQAQSINKLAEEFYELYGIKVRCEAISWGEAHSKYLTSIAGEVAPDIGTMGLTWGTEFGGLGSMVDLKEAFPEDMEHINKAMFPGILEASEHEGHIYGVPFDMSLQLMYYRTDIIKNPPKDWDELVKTLQSISKDGRNMLLDWGSLNWIGYAPFLWQAGGDFYDEDQTKAVLDTKAAQQAIEYFAQLYTKRGVPKTKIPVEQGMRTGDFPIAMTGNWVIERLMFAAPEIKGKWQLALLPAGPTGKRTTFIGGRVMGIFKQSEKKATAWKFIKFLFEPDSQVKLYKMASETQDSYLPPNVETWDELPMEENLRRTIRLQAMDAKGPPSVLGWDDSTRYIDQAIQHIVLEDGAPKENLLKANNALQRRIGKRFVLD